MGSKAWVVAETGGGAVTVPTSRASVGPFGAQEGMGSAAGMYRS
jgi:hypothetical protein